MIQASKIHHSKVLTKDGKTLGRVMNVVFENDPEWFHNKAFILVFQGKPSYLDFKQSIERISPKGQMESKLPELLKELQESRKFTRSKVVEPLDWIEE